MAKAPYSIQPAQEHQREAVLALYQSMLGGPAAWDEHYPTMEHIHADMARGNLFVMTSGDDIVAAISIDEDEETACLPNWSPELEPAGELARVAVRQDCRNRGLARVMMDYAFEHLRNRGYRGVHILVREENTIALRSYSHLGYRSAGDCLYGGKKYLCFERAL